MLKNMEQYANDLEGIVAKRTEDLAEEKKKTEELLHQMLPRLYSLQIKKYRFVLLPCTIMYTYTLP